MVHVHNQPPLWLRSCHHYIFMSLLNNIDLFHMYLTEKSCRVTDLQLHIPKSVTLQSLLISWLGRKAYTWFFRWRFLIIFFKPPCYFNVTWVGFVFSIRHLAGQLHSLYRTVEFIVWVCGVGTVCSSRFAVHHLQSLSNSFWSLYIHFDWPL